MKKLNMKVHIARFVFFSLLASIFFVLYRLVQSPLKGSELSRPKGDYVLMLVQCVLGIAGLFLPFALNKRTAIQVPDSFMIMYFIFLYCGIFLGEVRSFYYNIPYWDTILHGFSGVMLGSLGFSVIMLLNDSEKVVVHLSPLFAAIFAFCFAVSLGAIWEIYEFAVDGMMGLNMQKIMLEDGTALVGRAALFDTMKDIMVDVLGAAVMSTIGFIMMRKKPEWLHRFNIRG